VSLGAKLSLTIVVVVVLMVAVIMIAVPRQMTLLASDQADRRASGVATALAIAAQAGVEFADEAAVAELLGGIGNVDDVVYGVVVARNHELGRWVRPGTPAPAAPAKLHPTAVGPSLAQVGLVQHIAVDIETKDPALRGRLYLGFSQDALQLRLEKSSATLLLISTIIVAIGLLAGWLVGARLARPLRHLADVTTLVAGGDLRVDISVDTDDEAGLVAKSFREMVGKLRALLLEVHETALGLPQISAHLSTTAVRVVDGASTVLGRADETSATATSTLRSLDAASTAVSTLDGCVDRTSRYVSDMQDSNGTVATQVVALVSSVSDTASAVEQMARSIDETAAVVKAQDDAMSRMLRSIAALDGSTRQIDVTAARTSTSAKETQANALSGVKAIEETMRGIGEIQHASQTAAGLIRDLDARISRIDGIVDVIREVADQTTLFSLNAAIISAQAGEQGEAFAVIGAEIKALAQRTTSSTSEIGGLLAEIQSQSQRARVAMERGISAVDVGVSLGQETAAALQRIASSATASVTAAADIATLTTAQARDTAELNSELKRIAESITRISRSAVAQTTNNDRLLGIAHQMKKTAHAVESSTLEQRSRSDAVREALGEIAETATAVRRAQQQQTKEARQVLAAVVAMQQAARQGTDAAAQLDGTVGQLQGRAAVLQGHLQRFRL
jgi:methyl-accepting chemotaxis protein